MVSASRRGRRRLTVAPCRRAFPPAVCPYPCVVVHGTIQNAGLHLGAEPIGAPPPRSCRAGQLMSSFFNAGIIWLYDHPLDRKTINRLIFPDFPEFRPNLTPREIIRLGGFGGYNSKYNTFFICSHFSETVHRKQNFGSQEVEFPTGEMIILTAHLSA